MLQMAQLNFCILGGALIGSLTGFYILTVKELEEQRRGRSYRQHNILEGSVIDGDYVRSHEAEVSEPVDERQGDLLRHQHELIEKKRQIKKEQEEIDQIIQHQKKKLYGDDRDYDPPHYHEEESKVKRFMKLANALYVCDSDQSG